MNTGPDFELLKDAYAIIDGIPENAIDLTGPCTARGPSLEQGTICSPAGWLARHPGFNALGLAPSDDGGGLVFKGEAAEGKSVGEVMAQVFRMPIPDAEHLFGDRDTYTLGDDSGLSDKRLWLREVRQYLQAHGELGAEAAPETDTPLARPGQATDEQLRAP